MNIEQPSNKPGDDRLRAGRPDSVRASTPPRLLYVGPGGVYGVAFSPDGRFARLG
jgi:hypothetical protein